MQTQSKAQAAQSSTINPRTVATTTAAKIGRFSLFGYEFELRAWNLDDWAREKNRPDLAEGETLELAGGGFAEIVLLDDPA